MLEPLTITAAAGALVAADVTQALVRRYRARRRHAREEDEIAELRRELRQAREMADRGMAEERALHARTLAELKTLRDARQFGYHAQTDVFQVPRAAVLNLPDTVELARRLQNAAHADLARVNRALGGNVGAPLRQSWFDAVGNPVLVVERSDENDRR